MKAEEVRATEMKLKSRRCARGKQECKEGRRKSL